MAENLYVPANADKTEKYSTILPQIRALINDEPDLIANLANVSAVLREAFGFFWVGFYLAKKGELVLGPFQGPLACTRIAFGTGVCGVAALEQKTYIVPDVGAFPGHIACNSGSKSEIVVPLLKAGQTLAVLDVDSDQVNDFDEIDQLFLEQVVQAIVDENF
ncbi:MAG TPA: GAF domain-containing protein [Bacteroidetes bacterium]|nr:GAF domain-containing protein [Bacteroidota bacterium]